MPDDDIETGWQIDAETRSSLRLGRARASMQDRDYEEAILELEELLDEAPDHPQALFLLAESLLESGDAEGAVQAYEQHLEVTNPSAKALSGLAVARFDTCDLHGAMTAAREAIRLDPDSPEAHYYLGLALERIPDRRSEAITCFSAAQQLDPESYPFPLQVPAKDWERIVQSALALLPRVLQQFWTGVPIHLLDLPDLAELRAANPPITPTVSGMYQGTPPEEGDPWKERPEAMRLFTRNLLRSPTIEDVVEAVSRTLEHEARDWLGLGSEPLA